MALRQGGSWLDSYRTGQSEVAPLVRSSVLSQRVAAKRLGVGLGTIHRRLT